MTELTPTDMLPQFYRAVTPLMSQLHHKLVFQDRERADYRYAANSPAIVLTTDEFIPAQADYPIVFSSGDTPMPVVLTGMPGGLNCHVDGEGQWEAERYVPAYVRRYPFLLAKLDDKATDLTLCFDSESDRFVEEEAGNLFADDEPTDRAREILSFCEQFEGAVRRTESFVNELRDLDLLVEAEASMPGEDGTPRILRGFQMVSEDKLKALRGDQYRKLVQSGALALIFAHLFSLRRIGALFADKPGR
ncbi:SapC family protein [Sphingomonas sp. NCPPB 2930]|uniref:SapC family protein n=1 Tax=Sphingomonas sp. NCPPB 2930 TaxID=3162788 RepID=UPI0036DD5EBB